MCEAIPIPDFFYDIRSSLPLVGSSHGVVRSLTNVLYLITIGVFVGTFAYYSLPAQLLSEESIVTSEWQKEGYACKPLQKTTIEGLTTDWSYDECVAGVSSPNTDTVFDVEKSDSSTQYDYQFATHGNSSGILSFWDTWNVNAVTSYAWQKEGFTCKPLQTMTVGGLSTDWSYDECVGAVSSPNTDNVFSVVKSDASSQFDYRFATQGDSSGVVSIHDDRVASSVLQETSDAWSRDAFSCFPEPPYDNTFDVPYNYSECIEAIQLPSSSTIMSGEILSSYYPFGFAKSCYLNEFPTMSGKPDVNSRLEQSTGSDPARLAGIIVNVVCRACGGGSDGCLKVQTSSTQDAVASYDELLSLNSDSHGSFGAELICGETKQNGNGFRCFDKPKPPATKEQAIERYTTEYPPETICAPLKENSPFRCLPAEAPPSTKEQAIERYEYASEYSPEAICEPLKYNSPFQCTRTVEAPMVTRMSLSLATAQAVFALVGVLFVSVLRKIKK